MRLDFMLCTAKWLLLRHVLKHKLHKFFTCRVSDQSVREGVRSCPTSLWIKQQREWQTCLNS